MKHVFFAALLLASPALAEDASLTGTYAGTIACERTEDGRPGVFKLDLGLRVLHQADRLDIATWTAEQVASGARTAALYTGKAAVADGRVSGYVTACRPDFPYQEAVRIAPALADEDGLSFAADTIFITEQLPGREGRLIVEHCRWVMVRESAEPPQMELCDPGAQ